MNKVITVILSFLLCVVFCFSIWFNLLPGADNFTYDNILMSKRRPSQNIIIVGIDEYSIDGIGAWPWPRYYMAETLNKLINNGVAAIGIDVLYDTYSDEENDELLTKAAGNDKIVLAAMAVFREETQERLWADEYITPFEELNRNVNTGFINVIPDETDGVIRKALRHIKYGGSNITAASFPIEIYKAYCRSMGTEFDENTIPVNKFGQYNIDYAAEANRFTELSLWGVLNDEYPMDVYKDAVVLIGPYAPAIGNDNYFTPVDRRVKTYGVEIHANTLQCLSENNFKVDLPRYFSVIATVLVAIIALACFLILKPLQMTVAVVLIAAIVTAGAKILYAEADYVLAVGNTLLFLASCWLVNLLILLVAAQNERNKIRGLFGRFVSPEVVKEIISGTVSVELGGILKEVTLLFVDIRGFTAFSENNPPEKVVAMINRYFNLTSTAIQENGGTIDKYIGDATMAVFNAPADLPDHALCGVRAAWDMKISAQALRDEILDDFGVDLQFGIGINTGKAVVGNMGSEFRMDYTVIGDAVNTAARLESNAKAGQIIISHATFAKVRDYVDVIDLGTMSVKNKKEGIHVYKVINVRGKYSEFF